MASSPVQFTVEYPEKLSRPHLLAKVFLGWIYVGIPHGICLLIYGLLASIVQFIAFFAILFTGRFPRVMFNFVTGYLRWWLQVTAYLYFLRDEYPPFRGRPDKYPLQFTVDYPEKLSRLRLLAKVFLGWLYVGIPHGICLLIYEVVVGIVQFIVFFIILFTCKFPRGMFDFMLGYHRWSMRVTAYIYFLRDEYPPFNGRE